MAKLQGSDYHNFLNLRAFEKEYKVLVRAFCYVVQFEKDYLKLLKSHVNKNHIVKIQLLKYLRVIWFPGKFLLFKSVGIVKRK